MHQFNNFRYPVSILSKVLPHPSRSFVTGLFFASSFFFVILSSLEAIIGTMVKATNNDASKENVTVSDMSLNTDATIPST